MSSLVFRINGRQKQIFRIVVGSIRNVRHTHPNWNIPEKAETSIAKRVTGTLTAAWPSVLAASPETLSKWKEARKISPRPSKRQRFNTGNPDAAMEGGFRILGRKSLSIALGVLAQQARFQKNAEREKAFIEVLRLLNPK